jgi:flagellar hook-associated protein 3 FlgL
MRISSASAFQTTVENLQRRQEALVDAQSRLTTGKRVSRPSDDPAAAARAERALAAMTRTAADLRAMQASRSLVQQAEGALGDAGELLQQAREFVVAAGNGSYSDKERAGMAEQLRSLRSRLLAVANRDDGAGSALFGGQGSTARPFVDEPGGVRWDGVPGGLQVDAGEPLPMSVDGRAVWLSAPDPASGQDSLSVFDLLGRLADELATPGRDSVAIDEGVRAGLRDLDAAMDHLMSHRAGLGEALGRADAAELRLSQAALAAQGERSGAEDLDMVQAISDFQNQQTGYDAALRTYSMVQRMSLFDYLRG